MLGPLQNHRGVVAGSRGARRSARIALRGRRGWSRRRAELAAGAPLEVTGMLTHQRTHAALGLALSLGWVASLAPAQSILLKPRFAAGQACFVEVIEDVEQRVTGEGLGADGVQGSSHHTYGFIERVESVRPDGGARVAFSYERLAMATRGGMMPAMSFDSDQAVQRDDSRDLETIFRPMLGQTVRVDVGSDGRSRSAEGLRGLIERVDASAGQNPLWQGMRQLLTDDSFRAQMVDYRGVLYPPGEVKTGDTWSATLKPDFAALGSIIEEYQCRLERVAERDGRRIAVVTFTGGITAGEAGADRGPGGPPRLNSGTIRGSAEYDLARGVWVRVESRREMDFVREIPTGTEPPLEARLQMRLNSTLRVMDMEERVAQKRAGGGRP
jgi:hypothetical protein